MQTVPWLKCEISEGQFTGEYAVSGETFDGDGYSLFCPEEFVEGDPAIGGEAGWIKVDVLAREGDLLLVKLPQRTLENGTTITVKSSQVEMRPVRLEA